MPDKEKEGAGFPTGGVFVILAILLGYFIVPDQPFKTSRQSIPDKAKSQVQESASVEARLWEDPFEAAKRSKDSQDPTADGIDPILEGRIADKIIKIQGEELVILGVMVLGGEYADISEMRRRSRYALLSGLAEQGYYPDFSDQLKFIRVPISGSGPTKSKLSAVIPYESYSPDPSISKRTSPAPHVLVLWLNQDRLHPHPLRELENLISKIKNEIRQKENTKGLSPCKIKFKLLGPADSTTLKAIIDEVRVSGTGKKGPSLPALHDVEMYCWGATADEFLLIGEDARSNAEFNLSQALREKFAVRFYRTIGTDSQLMKALVEELNLRGVEPCSDHIALISEWDTIYGRTLPKAFSRSAILGNKSTDLDCKNIHRFSYMRGIDGQLSKANEGEKAPEPSSQGSKKGSQVGGIEKPLGNSQFDYLRRLSRDLKEIDVELRKTGCGVKAIGVLGSDIYDKLLVLQSIYDLFPGAIFFTTDLDARFLHPDELQWTRNLVIASNFGLRLHPALQKNTPPFRDSYQTSLFFAVRLAMTPVIENLDISDCLSVWLRDPMIFEVGRTDAFRLKTELDLKTEPDRQKDQQLCGSLISVLNRDSTPSPSLHPDLEASGQTTSLTGAAAVPALALLFLAVVCLVCERGWYVGRDASLRVRVAAGALFGLVTIAALLLLVINSQKGSLEPLELLEGISLWPTVYLRLVAFGMAVAFLVIIWRRSRRIEDELQGYFIDAEPRYTVPDPPAPAADSFTACFPEGLFEDYRRRNTLRARLWRVGLLVIFYLGLCGAIIKAFGQPFVPFRGDTSEGWCRFSLYLAVFFFVVLLFRIVDATSMAIWFIRRIQGGYGGWSEKKKSIAAKSFGVDAEVSNDWIGIEVIAKLTDTDNKFIYYPILVIILLQISRLSYFDRYDMPPGLLIVILLGLGFSISCAIRLRGAAEQFRKDVLKRLWEKQVRLAGEGNESKGSSKKIDLMIDHIKSIRSGAFVPFIEQPWVRATLIFITSGGGLTVLQYLPWFQ
jgi:hypothetical protein